MAGIIIVGIPFLLGFILGASADATILTVDAIPTVPALTILHVGIGLPFFAYSIYLCRKASARRERGETGSPDFTGAPGTAFSVAFALTGLIAFIVALNL